MRIITCGRKVRGTCHGDDLSYIFYNAGAKKLKHRTAEYRTIRRFVSILVKFAECGNPNIPLTDDATLSVAISQDGNVALVTDTVAETHDNKKDNATAADADVDADGNKCNQQTRNGITTTIATENVSNKCWPPVGPNDIVYKCLNISDELEVIDLPEADKLKLWDAMYADKSLLY